MEYICIRVRCPSDAAIFCGTCRFGRVAALPPAQQSVAAMPGVNTVRVPRIHIYLVVAAQPHEENNRLDIVEAVHPFSSLAPLSPDVY